MSSEEFDGGEPDEFAGTDLRTGHPAPDWLWRTTGHGLRSKVGAYMTPSRVVVAVIATLTLAALVATQLGYAQWLLEAARYRIQMVGVPELTETTIPPQPAAHLSMANWEKVPLPIPARQIHSFSADPSEPNVQLVCGFSLLETSPIHGEMTPRGSIAIWLSRDAGKTWTRGQTPAITGTHCQLDRAPDLSRQLTLWSSQDRGDTWHPLSKLQGIVPIQPLMLFDATSASATSGNALYLSAGSFITSRMLHLKAVEVVDDYHWAYLPPLPASRTSADHVGITSILGVTASDKLLAFGVNAQTGIRTDKSLDEQFDQQWLWSWDPHTQRWTSLAPPLPVTWNWCGDGCWRASLAKSTTSQQTVLWVRGFASENGGNDLYRLAVPADIA